jgi:hypothetical protein
MNFLELTAVKTVLANKSKLNRVQACDKNCSPRIAGAWHHGL